MVCRGEGPRPFDFNGLTAAPRPPPTCRRLRPTDRFFLRLPGAGHLTNVLYQKSISRPHRPIVLERRHVGGDWFGRRRYRTDDKLVITTVHTEVWMTSSRWRQLRTRRVEKAPPPVRRAGTAAPWARPIWRISNCRLRQGGESWSDFSIGYAVLMETTNDGQRTCQGAWPHREVKKLVVRPLARRMRKHARVSNALAQRIFQKIQDLEKSVEMIACELQRQSEQAK